MEDILQKISVKWSRLWSDSDNIGHQAARSGVLLFGIRGLTKGIQFVRTIILARLLFPADFGLFGLASISLGILDTFLQTGINAAVVQEKDDVRPYLNSAWTFTIIRNTLVALLIFFTAPLFALFFRSEAIVPMIEVLSVSIFISGFENIGVVLFQRELKYNKKFYFDICVVLAEAVAAIVLAYFLRSAWALVVAVFMYRIAGVAFSYIFHPFRPRFELSRDKLTRLLHFGKWVGLMGILSYLIGQGDYIAVGKILGPDDLGFYQLAFALGVFPAVEIARALGNILFPLFARIRHDKELLRRSFIRVARLIFSLTIPASVGLFILAPDIVRYIYGERWLPMVPVLTVIIIYGLFKSLDYLLNSLLLGTGRSKITVASASVQFLVMAVFIIPAAYYVGKVGVAWVVLVGGVLAQVVYVYYVRREIRLGVRGFLEIVVSPIVGSAVMYAILILARQVVSVTSVVSLVAYVVFGVVVYGLALLIVDRLQGRPIYESILLLKRSI